MSLPEDPPAFGQQDDEGTVSMLLVQAGFLRLFDTLTLLSLK